MGYSTTEGRFYIVELHPPFERMEIQFIPEEMSIGRTADIAGIVIPGRNNPLHQYTSGDDKLAFRLNFYADQADRRDVAEKCRWLMSLCMNDGGRKPAPRIKLIWGDVFQRSKWVVRSVQCRWSLFEREHGFFPRLGYADMVFTLDTDSNVPTSDLRQR